MTSLSTVVAEAARRVWPVEVRGHEAPGGHTPSVEIARRGPVRVLYYAPKGERRYRRPILFVYSLINRYYILDFQPGRSLIEYLTEQGHACYVVDWGVPGAGERHKTWGDYTLGFLGFAVRAVREHGGLDADDRIHLFGYCMGGTLALAYAALRPENFATLTAMAVPVDFHDDGLLSTWTRERFFNVDAVVDAFGNVPTWLMEGGFRALAPMGNVSKWRDLWQNRDDESFVGTFRAMERWSSDNVPFPGEVYRQYIRDCYQRNIFCKSEMVVSGERVDLTQVDCPLLIVIATKDHIVPAPSALAIQTAVGSTEQTLLEFPTGHIGLSTSSKGPSVFWPPMSRFLAEHD